MKFFAWEREMCVAPGIGYTRSLLGQSLNTSLRGEALPSIAQSFHVFFKVPCF